MALAPVPITATRRPSSLTESSHRAEWNDGPAKRSRPSMTGILGRLSWPTAEMTASATSVSVPPSGRGQRHLPATRASSKVHEVTSVEKRMWSRRS